MAEALAIEAMGRFAVAIVEREMIARQEGDKFTVRLAKRTIARSAVEMAGIDFVGNIVGADGPFMTHGTDSPEGDRATLKSRQ